MNTREQLIDQIHHAFQSNKYPTKSCFAKPDIFGEGQTINANFKNVFWIKCPLSILIQDEDHIDLLEPEAFQYFTPAYLLAIINHPNDTWRIHFRLTSQFKRPLDPKHIDFYNQRMHLFTREQLQVVLNTIQYMSQTNLVDECNAEIQSLNQLIATS
ncbi:hypothetical protein JD969_05565 [Planctomycetota bacterium]|nr:hypothetical protein JD969_05565 [Planctomycetota bacterium]